MDEQADEKAGPVVTMTNNPISREKLIAHLMESVTSARDADNDFRFIYITGRNMFAENMLAKLICGEFDE